MENFRAFHQSIETSTSIVNASKEINDQKLSQNAQGSTAAAHTNARVGTFTKSHEQTTAVDSKTSASAELRPPATPRMRPILYFFRELDDGIVFSIGEPLLPCAGPDNGEHTDATPATGPRFQGKSTAETASTSGGPKVKAAHHSNKIVGKHDVGSDAERTHGTDGEKEGE